MNPYRELGMQDKPACMHCLTSKWVTWSAMWAYWICQVCGEIWD